MSRDAAYHAKRAIEERRRAMASTNANARRVHLELAARYASSAGATFAATMENPPEDERKTAARPDPLRAATSVAR